MLLETITKKCPCGYIYKVCRKIQIEIVPTTGIVTTVPGKTPKLHNMPAKKENILSKECVEGDQDFQEVSLKVGENVQSSRKVMICPKCGSYLSIKIAKTETREEIEEDKQ